jgi:aspartate/glutamate racemase
MGERGTGDRGEGTLIVNPSDEMDATLRALCADDETIPPSVRDCAERLVQRGVWHQFSRNRAAMSCPDAAQKRNRLGHTGIPLWDELKSYLGEYDGVAASRHFMAHCRGDRELDLEKVREAIAASGEVRRVRAETATDLGTAYGIVNPFTTDDGVVQIFDYELHHPLGVPGTVMTNAGDHTWGVEFDPSELVVKLPGARWADIVQPQNAADRPRWGVREPETIGILTGNPCDSGLELCGAINTHLRRLMGRNSLGDVSMPRIVLVSTPQIGISMEMDRREGPLRNALLNGVDELCGMGAKIIVHPAHTTHYFAHDIAERAQQKEARFISMADATAQRLRDAAISEIALLGTRYVTDLRDKWSVYREAFDGLTVHSPSRAGWNKIHDLGYEIQQNGPTAAAFNWMRDLLREEVPANCKHVVLAMTEFSPILRKLKPRGYQGKILIDPLDIYAEAIAREYLGLPSAASSGDTATAQPSEVWKLSS